MVVPENHCSLPCSISLSCCTWLACFPERSPMLAHCAGSLNFHRRWLLALDSSKVWFYVNLLHGFISLAVSFAEHLSNTFHLCCVGFGIVHLFYVKNPMFSMYMKCKTIVGQCSDVGSTVSPRSWLHLVTSLRSYCHILAAVYCSKLSQNYCFRSVSVNHVSKPMEGLRSGQLSSLVGKSSLPEAAGQSSKISKYKT